MKFFCPGPINLPELVKASLLKEPPYFGGSSFHKIIKKIQPQLSQLFQTTNPILLCTGSGSFLMEQSIINFFSPKDKVVVINNGRYGQHWVDCAKIYGLNVKEIKADLSPTEGKGKTNQEIDDWLRRHPDTQGVLCQHVETTTGIKIDLDFISRSIRKHTNALFVVDAISSFLSEKILPDQWNIDVLLVSSHKGLSLPPGLGLLSISKKAIQFSEKSKFPKYYFDIKVELERQIVKNQTRFTPATQIIICLSDVLDAFEPICETLPQILDRSSEYCKLLDKELIQQHYIRNYSSTLNNSVTVGVLPPNLNAQTFSELLELKYNILLGKGTELLKESGIRIRTFGWDLTALEMHSLISKFKASYEEIRLLSRKK